MQEKLLKNIKKNTVPLNFSKYFPEKPDNFNKKIIYVNNVKGVFVMPTYDYECAKCGFTFEEFQSISEEPIKKCPKCKGKVQRLICGGAGVLFKCGGFYVTDSKKKSDSSKSSLQNEKKSGETAASEVKPVNESSGSSSSSENKSHSGNKKNNNKKTA